MRPERGRNKRLVLAALEMAPATTDELMARTGLARDQVRSAINQLAEAGIVARPAAKYSVQMHEKGATKHCALQPESA